MALTKTVNYTQEIPQALGYSAEITGTAGVVTAKIQYNNKMGRLKTGTYGSSESFIWGNGTCAGLGNNWEISGTETDVNAALNDLVWYPRTYDDAAITQDNLAVDRLVTDHKGEVLIEVEDRASNFSFVVGDDYAIYNGSAYIELVCTKVETTLSGKRIYGVYANEYDLVPGYDGITASMYDSKLTSLTPTVEIDNIVDYAIVNPHGDSDLVIEILDGVSAHDAGTTTLVGALLVPEPYFVTPPPTTIAGVGGDAWTVGVSFGEIAQDNNEMVVVQLLLKRDQNDPDFSGVSYPNDHPDYPGTDPDTVGDVTKNKPSYITDESYGVFSVARVNDRQARCVSEAGEVRWEFYGTPAQCNNALKYLQFYQKAPYRDFYIETRLITGRSRIYNHRGYN